MGQNGSAPGGLPAGSAGQDVAAPGPASGGDLAAHPDSMVLGGLALAALLLQLATIGAYGWFRDEFYYVACSRHLAFGYVDQPPMVALIAWLSRALFGDCLFSIRLLPAVTGAAVVYLAGVLAHELGGGRFAQGLAALCVLIAPGFLGTFHYLSMNAFEVLLWTLGAWVVIRIVKGGNPRLWLLFGVIAGVGLETKHSMLFFGLGVSLGLLLTPRRGAFRAPWIWLGGALALALFVPNLWWEVRHGWPTLEFLRNAQLYKNLPVSPVEFFMQQVRRMNPVTLPIWLAGLGWCLLSGRGRPFRVLGWTYLIVFAVLVAYRAKGYYLGPVYPLLFAAGGTAVESGLAWLRLRGPRGAPSRRWGLLRAAILVLIIAAGAWRAPLALPILPVDQFVRYQAWLGITPSSPERKRVSDLPQQYADMFGWREMVAEVARVYGALSPDKRARACVFGQNYGEAGAVEQLGRARGLPTAVSGHNNYFLWGPRGCDGSVLIVLGGDESDNRAYCSELERAGLVRSPHAMPYENDLPVYLCRLRSPLPTVWPKLKHYD
jgi:hypothetical protein